MTENKINITDMIKALQCIASQDADGDCYCDHFNAHLTCEQFGDNTRLDEKHMSCGGVLKDTQNCPYSQNTYGVCYEDGELWWLKDIVSVLTEIQQYRAIGTVEEFKAFKEKNEPKEIWGNEYNPVYIGDTVNGLCPICNTKFVCITPRFYKANNYGYCKECGQKLDWQ